MMKSPRTRRIRNYGIIDWDTMKTGLYTCIVPNYDIWKNEIFA